MALYYVSMAGALLCLIGELFYINHNEAILTPIIIVLSGTFLLSYFFLNAKALELLKSASIISVLWFIGHTFLAYSFFPGLLKGTPIFSIYFAKVALLLMVTVGGVVFSILLLGQISKNKKRTLPFSSPFDGKRNRKS